MSQVNDFIAQAQGYLGVRGGSLAHQALIEAYNQVIPLPVGYAVSVEDDWCDIFVTVMGDWAGVSHLVGRECGVSRHLEWCQAMGIWRGKDWPAAGDLVVFNFDGGPVDHIGIVERVEDETGWLTTIEGNWLNQVIRRRYHYQDSCIVGYARPRFDQGCVSNEATNQPADSQRALQVTADLVQAVIRGDWGNGQDRVAALTAAGYDAGAVQAAVNARLQ